MCPCEARSRLTHARLERQTHRVQFFHFYDTSTILHHCQACVLVGTTPTTKVASTLKGISSTLKGGILLKKDERPKTSSFSNQSTLVKINMESENVCIIVREINFAHNFLN